MNFGLGTDNLDAVKAYLQLVRVPNLFTAAADAAAGFALMAAVDGTLNRPHFLRLAALMAISAALYASGVIFNDCLDADYDRQHRPDRPIPSGAVALQHAFYLGVGLTLAALLAAMFLGQATVLYAALLITAIWLYNGVFKRFVLPGAAAMGLCRFLNMQLGMSTGMSLPFFSVRLWPELLVAPLLLAAYSATITLVATYEDRPAGRSGPWMLFGSAVGIVLVLVAAALAVVQTVAGWAVLGLLVLVLAGTFLAPLVRLTFASVRRAVGVAVIMVIAFDAALILGVPDSPMALWLGLGVLASVVPAAWLARSMSPS